MITEDKAIDLKNTFLEELTKHYRQKIIGTELISHEFGWLFFYNTEESSINEKSKNILIGTSPVAIDKETGDIFQLKIFFGDIIMSGKSLDEFYRCILNKNWFSKIGRENLEQRVFLVHLRNQRYIRKMQGRLP